MMIDQLNMSVDLLLMNEFYDEDENKNDTLHNELTSLIELLVKFELDNTEFFYQIEDLKEELEVDFM